MIDSLEGLEVWELVLALGRIRKGVWHLSDSDKNYWFVQVSSGLANFILNWVFYDFRRAFAFLLLHLVIAWLLSRFCD